MLIRSDFIPNVGGRERALRLAAGLVFVALGFALDMASGWRLAAYLIGVAALLTALARYCPIKAELSARMRRRDKTRRVS